MLWRTITGGGLHLIRRQLLVDLIVIAIASGSFWWSYVDCPRTSFTFVLLSFLLTYVSSDGILTKRWPITFPLLALLVSHMIRGIIAVVLIAVVGHPLSETFHTSMDRLVAWIFHGWDLVLIISMIILSICLFPAVQIPNDTGRFKVGIHDFYVPTKIRQPILDDDGTTTIITERPMAVRLYYPILASSAGSSGRDSKRPIRFQPYLNPQIAAAFCQHSMQQGGPPFLKRCAFLFHHWMLPRNIPIYSHDDHQKDVDDDDKTTTPAIATAATIVGNYHHGCGNDEKKVVIYSHGLGGCYDIYSYQPRYLVSHGGYIVLSVTHLDGSAACSPHPNGIDVISHDYSIDWQTLSELSYVSKRRRQTNIRIQELIQAAQWYNDQIDVVSLSSSSSSTTTPLDQQQPQQQPQENVHQQKPNATIVRGQPPGANGGDDDKNNHDHGHHRRRRFFFMGHSFGATSVLGVSGRHHDLVQGIIAHEPVTDWLPNDIRRRFFHGRVDYNGGTGGLIDDDNNTKNNNEEAKLMTTSTKNNDQQSLHNDGVPILIMHSDEWVKKGWGHIPIIRDMYQQNKSVDDHHHEKQQRRWHHHHRHHIISDCCHMEFSDTCMMTPIWLARAVGITGRRNPGDTAAEIATLSLDFIQDVIAVTDDQNTST